MRSLISTLFVVLSAASVATAQTASANVTLKIDSVRTLGFSARGFDLRVQDAETRVELTRSTDSVTRELVRIAAARAVLPEVVIEVCDSTEATFMRLRLTGVTIESEHVALSTSRALLEQQRLAQQEALSSLMSDYREAERELAVAEELGKTRITTRQDLARARDRVSDLKQRRDLLRQRQGIVDRQLEKMGPVDEMLTLRVRQVDIESR